MRLLFSKGGYHVVTNRIIFQIYISNGFMGIVLGHLIVTLIISLLYCWFQYLMTLIERWLYYWVTLIGRWLYYWVVCIVHVFCTDHIALL